MRFPGSFRRLGASFSALALMVGVLAAVGSTWPLVLHLNDHVIDGAKHMNAEHPEDWWAGNIGADVYTTVWILNWDLHALRTQPLRLFDANIFWPAPLALARSEHIVATALLGIPGRLVGNPITAHQTALLLCLVLDAWAAAWVTYRWTRSRIAALATGVLFATMPFHQAQLPHLQSLGTAGFPLVVAGLERWGMTNDRRWLALATGAVVWQMACGQYLAFFACITWALVGAVMLVTGPGRTAPRNFARALVAFAVASGVAALLYLPLALPYLELARANELPNNLLKRFMSSGITSVGQYLFGHPIPWMSFVRIPPSTLVLAVVGIVAWARVEWRRVLALCLVAAAGAVASMGPTPGGHGFYGFLAALIPGFQTMREPFRFAFLPHLVAVLLAGGGMAAILARWPRAGLLPVLALVGTSIAAAHHGLALREIQIPEPYRYLARCGGGDPLLELPAWEVQQNLRDAPRDLASTYHWLPLLNGRSGYPPPGKEPLMKLAWRLPAPDVIRELRAKTGVRWILLDCEAPRGALAPSVRRFCETPELFPAVYRRIDAYVLYDFGPATELPRPTPRWAVPEDCSVGFTS